MSDLDALCRAEWGRLMAALVRAVGDFDVAEDALQEAFATAVSCWADGPPSQPRAWLYSTARHKAIDVIRRRVRWGEKAQTLALTEPSSTQPIDDNAVPDERLRLIFTCCHPALPLEAQVPLTLRTVGGLTTDEIARALLVPAPTLAQRLVRAKRKIREAGIPYEIPDEGDLPGRLNAVMGVLYLIFNEGYAASAGDALVRRDLCVEAIGLTQMLRQLLPHNPAEVCGLLALMLLHDARRDARVDAAGNLVLLADQDRTLWNHAQIAEGIRLVEGALVRGGAASYSIEAAIAAVHSEAVDAASTDWAQIARLYDVLLAHHPSPVVELNRAVAVSMVEGPAAALALVDGLGQALGDYAPWHATRADLLRRLGQNAAAVLSYKQALERAQNAAERRFMAEQIAELNR